MVCVLYSLSVRLRWLLLILVRVASAARARKRYWLKPVLFAVTSKASGNRDGKKTQPAGEATGKHAR
jgi:hypothetical protein